MKNILRKPGLLGLALILSITLALMSAYIERVGPEKASYGNLCGPTGSDQCYKPVLKGGFPFPFLFDTPGVSVERQLSFGEDKLRVDALVANIAVYCGLLILMVWLLRNAAGRFAQAVASDE
ncbi:hypothetical protein [Massilia soli]|uniref:Uncharacterized protein n=1 Tax=Massilia soli TaxID=2792854 RepID=A0ABS7SJH5_9BURK|nr:hypothetical protein [Massilia soli]MBZ2206264.1 hypothetical protein [Massilia soli]